jgi:hypothetical protein
MTVPLIISINCPFLNGIEASIAYKSSKVTPSKWKLLYRAIHYHKQLTKGHWTNKWSLISLAKQNKQCVSPCQPLLTKLSFVGTLFFLTNHMNIYILKDNLECQIIS